MVVSLPGIDSIQLMLGKEWHAAVKGWQLNGDGGGWPRHPGYRG